MTHSRNKTYDTLIVGAGVIGAATAFALARTGSRVLVVERSGAVGHGSTSASAGIIRVHAADPQSVVMADDSTHIWREWSEFLEAPDGEQLAAYTNCGSVILDVEDQYIDEIQKAMTAAEVDFEYWHTQDLSDNVPYLDVRKFGPPGDVRSDAFFDEPTGFLAGAVFTSHSGYVGDPALAATNLMDAARRQGADLLLGTTVDHFIRVGERVTGVTLADGSNISAESVLVAAGPHADELLRRSGATDDFRVRTRRLREELHHVASASSFALGRDPVHVVDGDLGINFRPESGNAFLVGGNGALVDGETRVEDPDTFDESVTAVAWDRSTLRIARRIKNFGIPARRSGVVGLYDATDDWQPIYDRTCFDGLFVAMGTSGNQFKTAPIVGDLLRQIIELERDGIDHTTRALKSPISEREYSSAPYSRTRDPERGGVRG